MAEFAILRYHMQYRERLASQVSDAVDSLRPLCVIRSTSPPRFWLQCMMAMHRGDAGENACGGGDASPICRPQYRSHETPRATITRHHHETPQDNPGTPPANRGGSNIWRGFALATAGSFLLTAHAASPRPHARREHVTEADFLVGRSRFHCDLTP